MPFDHPADTAVRRRILLSAFACSPIWGSEAGVGWQWLLQIVKRHDVVLVTHSYFRAQLQPYLDAHPIAGLEVHGFEAPTFGTTPEWQLNSRLYYTWWQLLLRRFVRGLLANRRVDAVHHLTWGTLRFPCFLGGLGVPLVMGPLGGGEKAPLRLFHGLPLKIRLFDALRSLSLQWVRFDPLATWGPRRSAVVLCRSQESLRALPLGIQGKAAVVPEIGSPVVDTAARIPTADRLNGDASVPFKLLFAGRLLGWKGVAIAVGTVAKLKRMGWNVQFDIAGEGPLHRHLAEQIEALGVGACVRLLGAIPRSAVMAAYARADLFLFPSLHDSSGSVVLESLSCGLPVVCLDLGGPQNYLDGSCGIVVSTQGLARDQLEQALADAIAAVLADPARLARMSGPGRIACSAPNLGSHGPALLQRDPTPVELGRCMSARHRHCGRHACLELRHGRCSRGAGGHARAAALVQPDAFRRIDRGRACERTPPQGRADCRGRGTRQTAVGGQRADLDSADAALPGR